MHTLGWLNSFSLDLFSSVIPFSGYFLLSSLLLFLLSFGLLISVILPPPNHLPSVISTYPPSFLISFMLSFLPPHCYFLLHPPIIYVFLPYILLAVTSTYLPFFYHVCLPSFLPSFIQSITLSFPLSSLLSLLLSLNVFLSFHVLFLFSFHPLFFCLPCLSSSLDLPAFISPSLLALPLFIHPSPQHLFLPLLPAVCTLVCARVSVQGRRLHKCCRLWHVGFCCR